MKLSTRSRYGVRLMLALGTGEKPGPTLLKDVARREQISEKYLSQIIIHLKAKGLVHASRGAHGGYELARPAAEITLREIVEPLEGDLCLVDCILRPASCPRSATCATRDVWGAMNTMILNYLDTITLEDLVRKHRGKLGDAGIDFAI
ncbi:MAG TPA: Rrf2 family transcriptional regulator [Spirochaetota bacterium]|nr:Rrf2 family transcriptional regulator [Spirochaetota bacterium]HNT10292.1 Rrf2 family transcriptional regulator [Spirochaetota bacterium]